jgi:N-acetylmuramoyl-L-alanine amidase
MTRTSYRFAMRQTFQVASVIIFFLAPSADARRPFGKLPEGRMVYGADPLQQLRTSPVNLAFLSSEITQPKKVVSAPIPKSLRVMIDAGHGGKDMGAPGHHSTFEKEICLKIAHHVRRELERMKNLGDLPIEVMLTRENDSFIPLKDRVRAANDWGADLFVSIHANSSPLPRVRGFEVYFLSTEGSDEDARRLALIENAGAPAMPTKASVLSILSDVQTNKHIEESSHFAEGMFSAISRRILSSGRGVRQGPFTVLAGTSMPSVLVEVGYLTHKEESSFLAKDSYLKRLANAISTGIVEFAVKKKRIS